MNASACATYYATIVAQPGCAATTLWSERFEARLVHRAFALQSSLPQNTSQNLCFDKDSGDQRFPVAYGKGSCAGTPLLTSGRLNVDSPAQLGTMTDPSGPVRSK